jgi:hypothetical protein
MSWILKRVRVDDEAGFGLILVIGLTTVITGLVAVSFVLISNAARGSSRHVAYQQTGDAAEMGVDRELARLQAWHDAGQAVSGNTVTYAPASGQSEGQWAFQALTALANQGGTCKNVSDVKDGTSTGQYVSAAATNRNAVYSIGWEPSCATPTRTRVLKSEYLFSTFHPNEAILTGGTLDITGSVTTDSDTTGVGGIHANGGLDDGNNSLVTNAPVSASGTPCNITSSKVQSSQCGAPQENMPTIDPRQIFNSLSTSTAYNSHWYDLCNDGSVQAPPTTAGGTPCSAGNTVLGSGTVKNGFDGWTFTTDSNGIPTWSDGNSHVAGVYYAYHSNIHIQDNASATETVLAEADTSQGVCQKVGGNIYQKLLNITPYISGLTMMAGQDITLESNFTDGSPTNPGLIAAADQVDLNTSSAVIYGAVVAGDACDTSGTGGIHIDSAQGVTIHYMGAMDTPVGDLIRSTLWLEMLNK